MRRLAGETHEALVRDFTDALRPYGTGLGPLTGLRSPSRSIARTPNMKLSFVMPSTV